ncbi:MAG: hypothetical protein DBY06_05290 [Clostridiales bacterium]|nr:MAG: hypothetical protein DBY06_05290 [Clostridiales bacterium]
MDKRSEPVQIQEIVNRKFSRAFQGYDIGEVDAFLDEIIRDMERMEQELQLLELRNKMLLEELARANVQSGFLDPLPEPEKQEESGEGPSC